MTSPTNATIVAIRISIGGRTGYTMWAPPWIEDGEEWQAFLGAGDTVLMFDSAGELAAYVARGEPNDLDDHPSWDMTRSLPAREFVPTTDYEFDVDGVPDLVTGTLGEQDRQSAADVIDLVRRISECVEDGPLMSLLDDPEFGRLADDEEIEPEADDEGEGTDDAVDDDTQDGKAGDGWDDVRERLRDSWPLLTRRLSERLAWAGSAPEVTPATRAQFWDSVGILPVTITTAERTGYTLRCYLDDAAVFLGTDMSVDIFTQPRGLVDFCHSAETHDLSDLETWDKVAHAGELDVRPQREDRYDVTAYGPSAAEVAGDLADYCHLDGVTARLRGADAAGHWDEVVAEVSSCLRWHD
ncbi:MAG: hypothetical protein ACR2JQ_06370 [Mycobacteriales bacterium]